MNTTSESPARAIRTIAATDASTTTYSYGYDLVGNLSRFQDRNNRVLRFSFDDLDRLIRKGWRSGAILALEWLRSVDDVTQKKGRLAGPS